MERIPHGAVPIALPFDDEGDAPVPFTLTAAARRAIDPQDVPSLRVVPDRPHDPSIEVPRADAPRLEAPRSEAPDDLRPAQARALRRSGMRVATIAAAMGVEAALVTAWTSDVAPHREQRTSPRQVRAPGRRTVGRPASARAVLGHEHVAAAGLAVALARVDADGSALTLVDDRPAVLGAALAAIGAEVSVAPASVRVAVRAGTGIAADRLQADLLRNLGVPQDRILVGRWHEAADPDAVEIRVRVAELGAVRVVDAWAAVLMDRPHDVAVAT
jgi:hypothetical protein